MSSVVPLIEKIVLDKGDTGMFLSSTSTDVIVPVHFSQVWVLIFEEEQTIAML